MCLCKINTIKDHRKKPDKFLTKGTAWVECYDVQYFIQNCWRIRRYHPGPALSPSHGHQLPVPARFTNRPPIRLSYHVVYVRNIISWKVSKQVRLPFSKIQFSLRPGSNKVNIYNRKEIIKEVLRKQGWRSYWWWRFSLSPQLSDLPRVYFNPNQKQTRM